MLLVYGLVFQCSKPVIAAVHHVREETDIILFQGFVLPCSKPVIAAVQGACVGGGTDMLLVHSLVFQCSKPVIPAVHYVRGEADIILVQGFVPVS